MIKQAFLVAVFGILAGVLASLATVAFIELVKLGNAFLFVTPSSRESLSGSIWYPVLSVAIPAIAGLAVGVLLRNTRPGRPLTLTDTIEAAQTLRFDAPVKSGLATAVASVVSLGAGASVGQYGPVAHLGATLGRWLSRFTRETGFTPTMGIGCGAAAAIATAFNAPIAGLVFAHEVILRHYSLRAFAPVSVAAATGHLFESFVFERPPLFEVPDFGAIHAPEYFVFILIGIAGAFVAMLFVRAVLAAGRLARRTPIPDYVRPAVAGAVLGVVAIWLPGILGTGEGIIAGSVSGILPGENGLLILLCAKLLLTALCLGFGFAGGIFSPALVIGTLFGALVGGWMEPMLAGHFSAIVAYAICGMVAVTSPVIGAPLTAILIVFELTHHYDLTIAAMICVVFSNLVGYRLMGRSIFDIQLIERGVDLGYGRDKVVIDTQDISGLVTQGYVHADASENISELRERMAGEGSGEAQVVDSNGVYVGTVLLLDLVKSGSENTSLSHQCGEFLHRDRVVLLESNTLWEAMEQMRGFVGESIPVLSTDGSGRLVGVVYEAAIVQGYLDALDRIRKEEHGAT